MKEAKFGLEEGKGSRGTTHQNFKRGRGKTLSPGQNADFGPTRNKESAVEKLGGGKRRKRNESTQF